MSGGTAIDSSVLVGLQSLSESDFSKNGIAMREAAAESGKDLLMRSMSMRAADVEHLSVTKKRIATLWKRSSRVPADREGAPGGITTRKGKTWKEVLVEKGK